MLTVMAAAAASLWDASAAAQPRPNGWTYAQPGDNCVAHRSAGDSWIEMHLTRWNDLSDSILFYRPSLAPLWSEDGLPSGLTPEQEAAEGEAGYRLTIRIDGRPVEGVIAFNSMIVDHAGRPGPTYRFGIRQQPFIRALRAGRMLELYRAGRRLASFPIAGSAALATWLARCIALPPR